MTPIVKVETTVTAQMVYPHVPRAGAVWAGTLRRLPVGLPERTLGRRNHRHHLLDGVRTSPENDQPRIILTPFAGLVVHQVIFLNRLRMGAVRKTPLVVC